MEPALNIKFHYTQTEASKICLIFDNHFYNSMNLYDCQLRILFKIVSILPIKKSCFGYAKILKQCLNRITVHVVINEKKLMKYGITLKIVYVNICSVMVLSYNSNYIKSTARIKYYNMLILWFYFHFHTSANGHIVLFKKLYVY